jgi:hypothetical protein
MTTVTRVRTWRRDRLNSVVRSIVRSVPHWRDVEPHPVLAPTTIIRVVKGHPRPWQPTSSLEPTGTPVTMSERIIVYTGVYWNIHCALTDESKLSAAVWFTLAPPVWLSSELTLRSAVVSVAVITASPGVGELLISARYVPFTPFATPVTSSSGSVEENATASVDTGLP